MRKNLRNLLALLLTLAMLVSMFPVAFAEGEEIAEPVEESVTEEPGEEPSEEPAEEPAEEEGEEESEAPELPYGLLGLPEDFGLTQEEMAGKLAQAENDALSFLATAVPGVDYVEGQGICLAASEDYAQLIAEAYNADLVDYDYGVAVLQLRSATVYEAVEAGMNPDYPLPPVDPNYISSIGPTDLDDVVVDLGAIAQYTEVPVKQNWQMWMDSVGNPDTYLRNPSGDYQYMHDMVNTYEAWPVTTGWSGIKVAVLDTGVDYNHPDLQGKIIKGYDFGDQDSDPMDTQGHGTHCAGIIVAAQGNGIGGSGIAPGVRVLAVRVMDGKYGCTDATIIKGINYAVQQGAQIISMSLGGPGYNYSFQSALNNAYNSWVTVIASMGNEGTNDVNYPAAYDHVIAVASVNPTGERAPYSSYGPWCDIAAPGSDIWSTIPGSGYACWDGTSMACPVVSGVAALYMSWTFNSVSPDAMEKALKKAVNPCKSSGCGAGIIDASKLFAGDKTAPGFFAYGPSAYDSDGKPTAWNTFLTSSFETKGTVELPPDDVVYFSNYVDDRSKVWVVSDDGKAPSVLNGEIKHGWEDYEVSLFRYYVGQTVTLKVLSVSGMGVVSKVGTWKIKIVGNHTDNVLNNISVSVYSSASSNKTPLVAGKSTTLQASVSSSYGTWSSDVDQKVTWSIVSNSGCPGAKIDAKGKLTTKASDNGWVRVRATSVANPAKYGQIYVYIKPVLPVATMALNMSSLKMDTNDSAVQLKVTTLLDKNKNSIALSAKTFQWTSSNYNVAYVDGNGNVYPYSKGTATITCTAMDGSGKKATCKVTVSQLVWAIDVTGQPYGVSGTKIKYKATAYPSDANDKGVVWSIKGSSYVTVNQKGEVTIPSTVTNSYFYVVATAKDGSGVYGEYKVTVAKTKASSVTLTNATFYGPDPTKDKNGYTTAATLFSLDTPSHTGAENTITLKANVSNGTVPLWTSSKPSVATVDQNGVVTAVATGTATITAAAQDGSGKKATCKITVTNPVSYITIKSKNPTFFNDDEQHLIGIGKSASNSVVMGDAYGKPTNAKVTWSYKLYRELWDYNFNVTSSTNLTTSAVNNKWITLGKDGKLTVNKSIQSAWNTAASYTNSSRFGNLVIYVTATAQDGSGVSGTTTYMVTPVTTKLSISSKSLTISRGGSSSVLVIAETGGYYESYTITSSNPKVASARSDGYYYVGKYGQPVLGAIFYITAGEKTGSATITFKANDGSGKSVSVKVKVT